LFNTVIPPKAGFLFAMKYLLIVLLCYAPSVNAQLQWENVDSLYQPLPSSVHVYRTNTALEGKPNIAYYVIADIKDRQLNFTTDTTRGRRLTPSQYYQRNAAPVVVVNCTFFEFAHNSNLNLVMRNGEVLAPNQHAIPLKGKDTLKYLHVFPSALGITKKRTADVAWTWNYPGEGVMALPAPLHWIDSSTIIVKDSVIKRLPANTRYNRWKMQTAAGGGPVLLHNGAVHITNNEERKFVGKAINDKHPRTAMGYTADGKLIILAVQGRFPNTAEGATLTQEAQMLKDLGCVEALNLDGGGSSCLLVNGKPTIQPSDKEGQRPVPAVFIIGTKK